MGSIATDMKDDNGNDIVWDSELEQTYYKLFVMATQQKKDKGDVDPLLKHIVNGLHVIRRETKKD